MRPLPFPPFCFSLCPTCTQIDIHTQFLTLTAPPLHCVAQTSHTWVGSAAQLGPRSAVPSVLCGPLGFFFFILQSFTRLSVHSCCHCRFPPPLFSTRYQIANFIYTVSLSEAVILFFFLFCIVPIMRFLAPPVTSSSSQLCLARMITAVKLHSLEIHLDGGQESAQDRPLCQSHGGVISCTDAQHGHAHALFSFVDRSQLFSHF